MAAPKQNPRSKSKRPRRLPSTPCSPSELPEDFDKVAHDAAWERAFVVPIAREMKKRGVGYMVITIRDDGKCAYILDTEIPENDQEDRTRAGDTRP